MTDAHEEIDGWEVFGELLVKVIFLYPLSSIWMFGTLLLGIGNEAILSYFGGGLLSLAIGWVVMRFAKSLD